MSTRTVWLDCPSCGTEFTVAVELVSAGCRESYNSWTGWAPPEAPEWDVVGPEACEICHTDLNTDALYDRAIDSATQAHADSGRDE